MSHDQDIDDNATELAVCSHWVNSPAAQRAKRDLLGRGKYGNKRCNGFASKREANRAQELRLLQGAGEIIDLEFQVRYELIPKQGDMRAAHYIADFRYKDKAGIVHVEDAKGFRTKDYVLKRKLMKFRHNITVEEV